MIPLVDECRIEELIQYSKGKKRLLQNSDSVLAQVLVVLCRPSTLQSLLR